MTEVCHACRGSLKTHVPGCPVGHTMIDLDELAREIAESYTYRLAPTDDVDDLATAIAAALLRARNEAIEEAAKVVWDAGGDNVEFHCTAIRALKGDA